MTRVDGILFAAVAGVWCAAVDGFRGRALRRAAVLLAVPAAFVGAQLLFRLVYYGEWLPNVALVKLGPVAAHVEAGVRYVGGGLAALMPLPLVAGAALVYVMARDHSRRAGAALLLATAAAWMGYLVVVGGDIFPGWRHLVPVIVVCALALVLAGERLVERGVDGRPARWAPVTFALVLWFVAGQSVDPGNRRARSEVWTWNAEPVGRVLGEGFESEQPLLAVTSAGGIPYFSGLPCLDLLGLNDRYIARSRPAGSEEAWIGHARADAEYMMRRRPDLVHFGAPAGGEPVFFYAEPLLHDDTFQSDYTMCYFLGSDPFAFVAKVYVDRSSAKVGIVSTGDDIRVPPYLLGADTPAVARLDAQGRFYVETHADAPLAVESLPIPAGKWALTSPRTGVTVDVVGAGGAHLPVADSAAGPIVTVTETGEYRVAVEAVVPMRVYGVTLTRLP